MGAGAPCVCARVLREVQTAWGKKLVFNVLLYPLGFVAEASRGASGFWIENGEIAYPVQECTIAGNLRDMLKRIVPANDARAHLSRVVPSLLVEGMTLAGS